MNGYKYAFTLVELIVVIVILGVLSTIGFVSYNGYLGGARDSNRITQMKNIGDALRLYRTKNDLPLPDKYVTVTASGTTIGYQGYAGQNILETINYTNGGQDPKDDTYYTYYLTNDRKEFQLLGFLEESKNLETASTSPFFKGDGGGFIPQSYAADYTNRFPKVYGKKLGVLALTSTQTPLQEVTTGTFETSSSTQNYTAYYTDSDNLTASGYTLTAFLNVYRGENAPTGCPTGFIGVPGNPEFNTDGFCVAKYEMTYSDADTPNSTVAGTDWNTVSYVPGKTIVSMSGKYPIADINQIEAIAACQSMGAGYHVITNNEWMTIARSIEATAKNWSTGEVGQGNLYNGVSSNTTLGCDAKGGNTDPRTYATKTGPGESSCNPRRFHTLKNGQIIWDLSGNVWEHANKANTIDGSGYNTGQTAIVGSTDPTAWDDNGVYASSNIQLYGAATGVERSQGVGNIWYAQGIANNILLRGADAGDFMNGGLFSLNLTNNVGSGENNSIGFRCAK